MSARQPATRSSDGAGEAVAGVPALGLVVGDAAGDAEASIEDGDTDRWAMRGTGEPQPPSSAETTTKVLPSRTNRVTGQPAASTLSMAKRVSATVAARPTARNTAPASSSSTVSAPINRRWASAKAWLARP